MLMKCCFFSSVLDCSISILELLSCRAQGDVRGTVELIGTMFFSTGGLCVFITPLFITVPEWIDGLNGLIFSCRSFFLISVYHVFSIGGLRVFTTLLYVVLNDQCWKLFFLKDFGQFCSSFLSI